MGARCRGENREMKSGGSEELFSPTCVMFACDLCVDHRRSGVVPTEFSVRCDPSIKDMLDSHHAGRPARRAATSAPGSTSGARLVFTSIVDVRIDTALTNDFQLVEAFEQHGPNLRSFADKGQTLSVSQPFRERLTSARDRSTP